MDPIIDATWLDEHFGEVIPVHVGTAMGGADPTAGFRDAHLYDARFIVLDDALAGPAAAVAGRHPLPSPADFARALGNAGIGDDRPVVAYDDRNGGWASRLVWMLRIIGQPAALLDGGLGAWDGLVERSSVDQLATINSVTRREVPWPPDALADADEVAAHIAAGGVVVDSREAPRYRGEVEPIDAVAGHVPGAMNLPFTDNLDEHGMFRSTAAQAERFAAIADDPHAIVYCGSGVTACHNALAIHATGLPMPRIYVGSWSGWSSESERSIAVGNTP